jgi:hypothetical protein
MRYGILKSYCRFSRRKQLRVVFLGLLIWVLVSASLSYFKLWLPKVTEHWAAGLLFAVFIVSSPRRSYSFRFLRRVRPYPKRGMIIYHLAYPIFMPMVYSEAATKSPFMMIVFAACIGMGMGMIFLFWRPLILRLLIGADRRTRLFAVLN